jgi:hypothetical protein
LFEGGAGERLLDDIASELGALPHAGRVMLQMQEAFAQGFAATASARSRSSGPLHSAQQADTVTPLPIRRHRHPVMVFASDVV